MGCEFVRDANVLSVSCRFTSKQVDYDFNYYVDVLGMNQVSDTITNRKFTRMVTDPNADISTMHFGLGISETKNIVVHHTRRANAIRMLFDDWRHVYSDCVYLCNGDGRIYRTEISD